MKRRYACVAREFNRRLDEVIEKVYGVPYDGLVVVERPRRFGIVEDVEIEVMCMLANDPQTNKRMVLWSGLLTGLTREVAATVLVIIRAYRAGVVAADQLGR